MKTRRTRLVGWLCLVLAMAGGLVFVFFFSAAFTVADVQATGAREEVGASAVSLAQIPQGRPLARVSQSRVNERVVQDPRIAAVSVDRDWPSRVRLVVTEREPAVALRGRGSTWLADAEGVVFEQVTDPSNKLPLIELGTDPQELHRSTVVGLAELWRLRPDPAELQGDLTPPSVDRDGGVQMAVGQVTLKWGPPTDNELKWSVVTALIGQESIDPQGEIPMTIDVRIPGTPVVGGLPQARAG